MHRLLTAVLSGTLILVSPVFAAEKPEARTVSVTGEAEIKVVPDEVIFTLGVIANSKDLPEVKRISDQRLRDLLAIAAATGIAAKDVQTDFLNVDREYTSESGRRIFVGYVQRTTVVVTLRDIGKFEEFLTKVLQGGIEYVHGIDFRTSQLRKHRDEARAAAIKAAREKAAALAGDLGEKIGRPRTIQEVQNYWWSPYRSWWGRGYQGMATQNVSFAAQGGGQPSETSLAPGTLSVRASVNVTFDLQ